MPQGMIKTQEEIKILREGGKLLAKIVYALAKLARPGITTLELDNQARKMMVDLHVKPSFLDFGEPPYPAVLCASNNEVIVHGIPNNVILKDGDILGIDCGIWYKGLCTDMAISVPIGKVSKEIQQLLDVTKKSLDLGISQVKAGNTIGDIGQTIQTYVESFGYGIIRELVGHGVGYGVHEEPKIPNFGIAGSGLKLETGMVLAIEPMVSMGDWRIEVLANNWDIATKDKSLTAHFEHTVAVTDKGCDILTLK